MLVNDPLWSAVWRRGSVEAGNQVRGCCNKPGDVVAWAKSQRDRWRRCPGVQQDTGKGLDGRREVKG